MRLDMKEITGNEFRALLNNSATLEISNLKVIITRICVIDLNKIEYEGDFYNIHFEGTGIKFNNGDKNVNESLAVRFIYCKFHCPLTFQKVTLGDLTFENSSFHNNTYLRHCNIDELNIKNCQIEKDFKIRRVTIQYGNFEVIQSCGIFSIHNSDFSDFFSVSQSDFSNMEFNHCTFVKYFDFISNKFKPNGTQSYHACNFGKTSFFGTQFPINIRFSECTFLKVSSFKELESDNSILMFLDCTFEKFVQFNSAKIKKLKLENIKFNEIVSFQETFVDIVEIDKTIFEKGALFEDLRIKSISKCDRKTFRNIKLQLQKSENKIDYNRFRSYELAAYYRELKWCGNFKDKFILASTLLFTGFDNSWRKAIGITLAFGLIFYSLFYLSENLYQLNINCWKEFISGYIRFLIVTDFYNPLTEGRTYIDSSNTIGWFLFILGKIVIAFGIYEMIQAFRKFKA